MNRVLLPDISESIEFGPRIEAVPLSDAEQLQFLMLHSIGKTPSMRDNGTPHITIDGSYYTATPDFPWTHYSLEEIMILARGGKSQIASAILDEKVTTEFPNWSGSLVNYHKLPIVGDYYQDPTYVEGYIDGAEADAEGEFSYRYAGRYSPEPLVHALPRYASLLFRTGIDADEVHKRITTRIQNYSPKISDLSKLALQGFQDALSNGSDGSVVSRLAINLQKRQNQLEVVIGEGVNKIHSKRGISGVIAVVEQSLPDSTFDRAIVYNAISHQV